jgi:GntR family transcriptional regulator
MALIFYWKKEHRVMTDSVSSKRDPRARTSDPLFRPTERFFLNPESPLPLYHQMEKIILDRIAKENVVGRMLPREIDLAKIFGVSRTTVKKVADSLMAKGMIQRRRSVGTQIVRLGVVEDLGRLTSYTEQMASRGLQVSTDVLETGRHIPEPDVRNKLQIGPEATTTYIRRLRGTSEVFPVVLLQSEIPAEFGVNESADFHGSLYQLLEREYRIAIEWANEEISAAKASVEEASRLQIPVGDPVLIMERLSYTRGNQPVEFVRAVYRPEHYTFSIRLKR